MPQRLTPKIAGMIERFNTSIYQLIGGMGSSSLGMAITSETTDVVWLWIGRIALVVGLIASIVALLNGLKVLSDNISKKVDQMKKNSIVGFLREVRVRIKAETPKFFLMVGRFFLIVALASLVAITTDKQLDLNLSDTFRQVLSSVFVASLIGAVVSKLAVKDTNELYKELEKNMGR